MRRPLHCFGKSNTGFIPIMQGSIRSRWTSLRKRTYGRRPLRGVERGRITEIGGCMVHTLIASTPRGNKFFYNINAKVGARAVNRGIDVQLVQFGYFAMLRSPKNVGTLSVAERDAFSNINLGMPCDGTEMDPLVRSIRAHQASRGGTQDGLVTELKPGHISYSDATGLHTLMLVALNNSMRDLMEGRYPRIDLHDSCPADLKKFVTELFTA
ncbi:MAG: hypothetical protein U1E60_24175 [Reyranellaceae bacterium]